MMPGSAEFGSILRVHGYMLTTQRQAVLEIIKKNREKHLSPEQIYDRVKSVYPGIGRATVYRTVQLFKKIGLVRQISLDDGSLRYQMADPEEKHEHHHLICEICGEVIDIQDEHKEEHLEFFKEKLLMQKGFTLTNRRVQLFGRCKKCSEKLKTEEQGMNNVKGEINHV